MANLKDLIVNGVSRFIGKIYASGGIVGDLEGTASNASKINGHSVNADVPSDAKFTDTDTWRGIQDNLTSDSTTDSLSANQGKVLKDLVDGKASSSHTHDDRYYTESEIDTKFAFNYLYGYLQSDVALVNLADEKYHKLPMSKSDNSRGGYIQLSDDGTYLTFLKSGLVDFTAMISITSTNDVYARFCVAKITTSGEIDNRFGREIRMPSAQDHGGETIRRIIHVNAGDKVCLTFYMPTWVGGGSPQGTIKANSPTNSTGLMGQYVLYD